MIQNHSIQTAIHKSIIVFSLLLAMLLLILMIFYAFIVEDNVFNRLVASEARFIVQHYHHSGEVAAPRQPFMTLYPGWQALPESVRQLHQLSPERVEFPIATGGVLHLQAVTLGATEWVLAADVSAFEVTPQFLSQLWPYLAFTLLIVLLAALTLSRYLSQSIIRPLQQISEAVQRHEPGTLFQTGSTLPGNEIGYLADAIEQKTNQLQAALARETDFTRDISHELRTPVTVFKIALSRLHTEVPPDAQTLARLTEATVQMEQRVNVLLALARAESLQTQPLCLLAEIEACLVNHPTLLQQHSLQLELSVAADYRLCANQNLLHILLNNLIDNALTHASCSKLHINLTGHQLTVCNPAPQSMTEHVPADWLGPGVKSDASPGIGQGLHIVNRICQGYRWQLTSKLSNNWFYLCIDFTAGSEVVD